MKPTDSCNSSSVLIKCHSTDMSLVHKLGVECVVDLEGDWVPHYTQIQQNGVQLPIPMLLSANERTVDLR